MKVITAAYPIEPNWKKWVIFDDGAHSYISLVFLMRLAAYARDVLKRPLHLIAGFRTRAEQQARYDEYLKGGPYANVPGSSAHEFSHAVDAHGPRENYPELVADSKRTPLLQTVRKYGLIIPNWSGKKVWEWWHIQPVESMSYPVLLFWTPTTRYIWRIPCS